MFIWMPGWRQLALPAATHSLIVIVLSRHDFSVWTAIMFGLLLISVLRQIRTHWPRIGSAIPIVLPCSPLPPGETDPATRQVVRVIWSLPRWLTIELASPAGREVVDIFDSEMAAEELAMLRRWAQLDKMPPRRTRLDRHRFSRRQAGGRPEDP